MSRLTITNLLAWSPLHSLLVLVENDPDSFTQGRRNNDLVNWFILKRLNEMELGLELRPAREYVKQLEELLQNRHDQTAWTNIKGWEVDYENKVKKLWSFYGRYPSHALYGLWLPTDYEVGPTVHKDQLSIADMV